MNLPAQCVAMLWVSLTLVAPSIHAGTITVTADGVAKAPLVTVELSFSVAGEDTMALDAFKSFKAAKTRGLKAIQSLEIEGLAVHPAGLEFGPVAQNANVMMMAGGGMPDSATKLSIRETLRVTVPMFGLSGEEAMTLLGEVTDTAIESGMKPAGGEPRNPEMLFITLMAGGQPDDMATPFATTKSGDQQALRRAAHAAALKAARQMATGLAELSGTSIGSVDSIEVEVSGKFELVGESQVSCRAKLKVVFTTE